MPEAAIVASSSAARAEEGVHRPLAIGSDEDQAARGWRLAFTRGGGEIDPAGADVVAEDLAQLVAGDLADERAACAQRRHPGERVRRRSARDFLGRTHRVVQHLGLVGIDQRHPAAVEPKLFDQRFVARRHDIDDGVADGDDVERGFGHEVSGGLA